MVKDHPILMSTPMVIATLDDLKIMTRRIIKVPALDSKYNGINQKGRHEFCDLSGGYEWIKSVPNKYQIGDILWVREKLYQNGELGLEYVADKEPIDEEIIPNDYPSYRNYAFCNIPSIHMPKWACRIFLEITDIKIERLHDITWQDIEKEGIRVVNPPEPFSDTHGELWERLWVKINGQESFNENHWVWVIAFKKLKP